MPVAGCAAIFPFGAISESSPSSGFSAAKITRKGTPLAGAKGDENMLISTACPQPPAAWACATPIEAANACTNSTTVAHAAKWRAENNGAPWAPSREINDILKAAAEPRQTCLARHLQTAKVGRASGSAPFTLNPHTVDRAESFSRAVLHSASRD